MKTERNILFAFFLNLGFSVFEFFSGIFTGSVAIISDALHDIGDATLELETESEHCHDKHCLVEFKEGSEHHHHHHH